MIPRVIALLLGMLLAQTAFAQEDVLDRDRYGLEETDGGFLRVDRESGLVSLCQNVNDAWRCAPVPDAQRALEDEIDELRSEVEKLSARNDELEAKILAISRAADEALNGISKEDVMPKTDAPSGALTQNDEEQIDRALDFTEKAMRRFFGLMKDLRDEFESSDQ
ncbi:hypothetical protein GR183_13450 [Stappia sp. GBMRC 2046]|uniref:Uncharacterized protein n=1 Tax=Stappia sediminis TaxID=2692190 RepID=A0A7X3LVP2_9HYPH|nr:aspartyl-phosphate phosphatase Spo0E family protein [Stappia sediminis]MXN65913.1 hypothetical protein [Stappia sediminis]